MKTTMADIENDMFIDVSYDDLLDFLEEDLETESNDIEDENDDESVEGETGLICDISLWCSIINYLFTYSIRQHVKLEQ